MLQKVTSDTFYIDGRNATAYLALGKEILRQLELHTPETTNIIILCIGTDRATGDCLGPLVGDNLKSRLRYHDAYSNEHIYGTLQSPVHAMNLADTISQIYQNHSSPFVIAIDASLGSSKHIGYATFSTKAMLPGKGVQKKLPAIGHLSITGIVNLSGFNSIALLQTTRLYTVKQLADTISKSLYYALTHYEIQSREIS